VSDFRRWTVTFRALEPDDPHLGRRATRLLKFALRGRLGRGLTGPEWAMTPGDPETNRHERHNGTPRDSSEKVRGSNASHQSRFRVPGAPPAGECRS